MAKILPWCEQCQEHGHTKWLFLGHHCTHRWYLIVRIRLTMLRLMWNRLWRGHI